MKKRLLAFIIIGAVFIMTACGKREARSWLIGDHAITAFTSARYVLVALLKSVSPEKLSVGIRFHANTAVAHCRRFESIMARNTDTAMLAILNSSWRISDGTRRCD